MPNNIHKWLSFLEANAKFDLSLDLSRVHNMLKILGLTKFACPIVTIAGTNGKGSCVAFLESILLDAKLKVGAFTSPHILKFNERFRINGKMISDHKLCIAFSKIAAAYKDNKIPFTYFEFCTLVGLWLFKRANLDIILLEVGLGGRFDSVNAIDPDIAIITTISLDHTDRLGTDREQIGFEKAGILRPNKPTICGDFNPPQSILNHAAKLNTPLYLISKKQGNNDDRNINKFFYGATKTTWWWHYNQQRLQKLPLPKLPVQNAAGALMAIHLLCKKFTISPTNIHNGILKATLVGRLQVIAHDPEIIIDVAHNPESVTYLANSLQNRPHAKHTHAVLGILADKDITATLQPIKDVITDWYIAKVNSPRSAQTSLIKKCLVSLGASLCYTHKSIAEAYKKAIANSAPNDRIIVFGSFYTVAAVLQEYYDGHKN